MAGFGKSFSDAYEKSASISQAGNFDLIKEKLKQNEDSRQSGTMLDALEARIVENASKSVGPDGKIPPDVQSQLSAYSKSFDALRKAKLSPTETLSVAKAIAPDQFKDQTPINVYNVGQSGELTQAGQVQAGSKVFKQALTPEEVGARASAAREATTENPTIDQTTQGAIAALEFINPRIDNAIKILDQIGPKEFENLATQVRIGANNEFLVPNGSKLEELVAELNDTKITGFGIAGSAYSVNEKQVVEGGLNPIGKGFNRFKRDLMRNKDFFTARARSGTMGLKEARKIASKGSTYSGSSKSSLPPKGSAPKGAKGWDTEKGEWVF